MWTHRHPYQRSVLTYDSIRRRGELALYRALNIGSVIGFIGSGVSAGYEMPGWSGLAERASKFIRCKIREAEGSGTITSEALKGLKATLQHFVPEGSCRGEDIKLVFELCDTIARELDRLDESKAQMVQEGLRREIADGVRIIEDGTIDFSTKGALEPIFNELGIRRFLTVNYDLLIERYLTHRGYTNAVPAPGPKSLQVLLDRKTGAAGNAPPADVLYQSVNSLGQGAITAALTANTLGDALTFSALPQAHAAEVFHLHGWSADPSTMIVTEADYQRTYVRRDAAGSTFGEILETMFLGNDVVFIGIGMQEEDLLRPLRQFAAEVREVDTKARNIIALIPYEGRQKAIATALELKTRYGVSAIHYGEGTNWLKRMFLRELEEEAKVPVDLGEAFDHEFRLAVQKRLEKAKEAEEKAVIELSGQSQLDWCRRGDRTDLIAALKEKNDELLVAVEAVSSTAGNVFDVLLKSCRSDAANTSRERSTDLRTKLLTEALKDKLLRISEQQRNWFKDWIGAQEQRRPNSQPQKWTRHAAEYQPTPGPDEVLKTVKNFANECGNEPGLRRILRLTGPRGCGKGSFFVGLQQGQFMELFPIVAGQKLDERYRSSFFAHTSLSPEFYSVISALNVWLETLITGKPPLEINLEQPMQDYPKLPNDRTVSRLRQLEARFEKYRELHGENPEKNGRLFVCFLGLDRLCDRSGVAFSPMHRALFRLLTDDRLRGAPLDLVLIAGETTHPIRYLSETGYRACDEESWQTEETVRGPTAPGENFGKTLSAQIPVVTGTTQKVPLSDIHGGRPSTLTHQTRLQRILLPWRRLPRRERTDRHWLRTAGGSTTLMLPDDALKCYPALHQLLKDSVALDTWVSKWVEKLSKPENAEATAARREWFEKLEHAALRHGELEVIRTLSDAHRWLTELKNPNHEKSGSEEVNETAQRRTLLKHLAIFSLPVQVAVLEQCPGVRHSFASKPARGEKDVSSIGGAGLAENSANKETPQPAATPENADGKARRQAEEQFDAISRCLDGLAADSLIIQTLPPAADPERTCDQSRSKEERRYSVHPRMREYLAHQMGFSIPDSGERSHFELSLYSAQPKDLPVPSESHFRLIHGVIQALIDHARDSLTPYYKPPSSTRNRNPANDEKPERPIAKARDIHAITHCLRGAYSIIRGTLSLGALSRLGRFESKPDDPEEPYEIYRAWLRGLLNAATGISDRKKNTEKGASIECDVKNDPFPFRHPFYRDELLWLLNESAVTAFAQGRLYEALPIFQHGLELSQRERTDEHNMHHARTAERRLTLNYALAQIERGNLSRARSWLERLSTNTFDNKLASQSLTRMVASGYLGLLDHLGGQIERAQDRYEAILAEAKDRGLLRTLAIFHRHYADLLRLQKRREEADHHIRMAILAASQEGHKDILHFALVAEARLDRDHEDREVVRRAQRKLDDAERYAREMGLIKLEVDALKVRSEIILSQGETEQAGRVAVRAIALANRNGLRLRKVAALITYARILQARGQHKTASTILSETSRSAERFGYQIKAELIRRLSREPVID